MFDRFSELRSMLFSCRFIAVISWLIFVVRLGVLASIYREFRFLSSSPFLHLFFEVILLE